MSDTLVVQAQEEDYVVRFPHLDDLFKQQFADSVDADAGALLAQAAAITPADTNGWDTVFAIRVADVNAAIRLQGTSPKTFNEDLGSGYTAAGNFGVWQITRGGDGQNLNLVVPVTTGAMTFSGKSYPMDGAQIVVQIKLQYLPPNPDGPVQPTEKGTFHALQVNPTGETPQDPAAAVISIQFPGTQPPIFVTALMTGIMAQWFNDNLEAFVQVFSTVNLNLRADTASLQWLKPTYTSYAYADGSDDCSSLFGVLCMTAGRSPAGLSHELSPSAVPRGQRSGFLISQQTFMRNSILPGLPAAFKSAKPSDFELINNDTEVVNTSSGSIELDGVTYGAITYHPYVDSFDLVINTAEIVTTLTVKVQISPGIVTYVDIKTFHGLKLQAKTDGTQTIGFSQTRNPQIDHRTQVNKGIIITEAIAGIIVAVAGLIAGRIVATVARRIIIALIVGIIAGIITGIELILEDVIAKGVADAMPAIDPLIKDATAPIVWPTQASQFTVQQAALNLSVQLSGDPGFAGPDTCAGH